MRFVSVYDDIGLSQRLLFQLLRERVPEESISHRSMPDWDTHCSFIAGRPYEAWYLIESRAGYAVGAIYLSKQREIGVGVLRAVRRHGYAERAIVELMRLHPGRHLANINPQNHASLALFRKLGFAGPIQVTLERA